MNYSADHPLEVWVKYASSDSEEWSKFALNRLHAEITSVRVTHTALFITRGYQDFSPRDSNAHSDLGATFCMDKLLPTWRRGPALCNGTKIMNLCLCAMESQRPTSGLVRICTIVVGFGEG